jgi:pSer/pThr/pTyr-binding forkhead associated (FHA) protein
MADPRLNSLHLEPGRREEYRRAREILLQSRGNQTCFAEGQRGDESVSFSNTVIQNVPEQAPTSLDFWLKDKEFIYPLKIGLNTMGRSSENDIVVQDGYVSRRHCAILVHTGRGCELHDTASKNGTYLNGTKITAPVRLVSGDEIRICQRQFTFVARHEAPGDAIQSATLME